MWSDEFRPRHKRTAAAALPILVLDRNLSQEPSHRNQDKFTLVNTVLGPWVLDESGMGKYGFSGCTFKGKRCDFVTFRNKNIVTPYFNRMLQCGLAQLFPEHTQGPYLAGLWLFDIEDGLNWRRAGASYLAEKLDSPSLSWIWQPGL